MFQIQPSSEVATRRNAIASRFRSDAGQTTAEYALVLLGVAAIAMLLLTWARGTGAITELFDAVLNSILDLVP